MIAAAAYFALILSEASPAPPPANLSIQGKVFTLLKDEELRTTLLGKIVFDPECGSTSRCTAEFSSDGSSYRQSSDRLPFIFGTYVVLHDQYCVSMLSNARCKALFRAHDGTYTELLYQEKWLFPTRVVIAPFVK